MFTINRTQLKAALADVSKAVTKANLPILEYILFSLEGQQLRLGATDLELTIQRWIPLADMAFENEAIAIPGSLINNLVVLATEETICFNIDPETLETVVECGANKNKIKCLAAEDFPQLPTIPDQATIQITGTQWQDIARKVAYAASPDSLRLALTGVFLEFQEDTFQAVATDGFRIAVREFPLQQTKSNIQNALVPAKAISKAGAILNEETIQLAMIEGSFMAYTGDTLIACQTLEARFPDWRQIMPGEFKTVLTLEHAELDRSIRQALVVAREANSALTLAAEGYSVVILGENQIGSQSHSVIASLEAGQATVSFNGIFLLQALKALIGAKIIKIEINAENKPIAVHWPLM